MCHIWEIKERNKKLEKRIEAIEKELKKLKDIAEDADSKAGLLSDYCLEWWR